VRVVTSLAVCIMCGFGTSLINRLLSHLYLSFGKLQKAIAGLLSEEWYLLSDEDRQLLVSFQFRLDKYGLATCPFNLFTFKPTNLLTILSLIVTYDIGVFGFSRVTGVSSSCYLTTILMYLYLCSP